MTLQLIRKLLLGAALVCAASIAPAQALNYGASVNHEQARKAMAAAVAEARRMNLTIAIAVVDTAGQLVAFERMDNVNAGSVSLAQDKASSSAMFRRPTKVFQDAVAAGGAGLRLLTLRGASASEGGLPLIAEGKVIGGIGVSGGSSEQDGIVAKAGLDALTTR